MSLQEIACLAVAECQILDFIPQPVLTRDVRSFWSAGHAFGSLWSLGDL